MSLTEEEYEARRKVVAAMSAQERFAAQVRARGPTGTAHEWAVELRRRMGADPWGVAMLDEYEVVRLATLLDREATGDETDDRHRAQVEAGAKP